MLGSRLMDGVRATLGLLASLRLVLLLARAPLAGMGSMGAVGVGGALGARLERVSSVDSSSRRSE